ncbi:hypothetical protein JTP77_012715 [Streptomyces sp. S9]|nr:hypothetical protein [Streptomyces sp. S9]
MAKHLRSGDLLITTVGHLAGTLALQRAWAAARSVDIGYFATGFPTLDNVPVCNVAQTMDLADSRSAGLACALRVLAQSYAEHPAYRQEWRP